MAIVQKGNKQLRVSDEVVKNYLDQGFKQVDSKGKVVKEATGGFAPTMADINALKAENEKLKADNIALKAENEKLKAKK